MITEIYADNFRSLNNFQLKLGQRSLLLGANGSGKTTVLDLLRRIQGLIVGGKKVAEIFGSGDLSTLQKSGVQRFELRLSIDGDRYGYRLVIEHEAARERMRIKEEHLEHNEHPLFSFETGQAQLYRDNYSPGPLYPFDWSQSGLGVLQERPENRKLTRFREEVANWIIVHPLPPLYDAESRSEDEMLEWNMANFVSWYRRRAQENMGALGSYFDALKDMLPGFDSLSLVESGERARLLKAVFKPAMNGGKLHRYQFGQLSDGQRALIALYALIHLAQGEIRPTLLIDEPDNYLSLREIQPWLVSLVDACGENLEQVVIISHHPTIIDYLGADSGRWFAREAEGPTRVSDEPKQAAEGLTLSETIARDW